MSTLILTQNNNVARHLARCEKDISYHNSDDIKEIADQDEPEIKKGWIPRTICTLQDWVALLSSSVLRKTYPEWTVLSPTQEHFLWHEIISQWQESMLNNPQDNALIVTEETIKKIKLLNPDQTASNAAKCWERLRQHLALETPYLSSLRALKLGKKLWKSENNASVSDFCLDLLNDPNNSDVSDARNSEEFRYFIAWQREFQERCEDNCWIDRAALPSLLTAFLQDTNNIISLPNNIIVYGFISTPTKDTDADKETDIHKNTDVKELDERNTPIAPQTIALLKSLAARSCNVSFAQDPVDIFNNTPIQAATECSYTCSITSESYKQLADSEWGRKKIEQYKTIDSKNMPEEMEPPLSIYENTAKEFYAAAQQARALAESMNGKQNNEQEKDCLRSIGVIVPKLDECREQIVSIFDEVLCPRRVLPEHANEKRPYTISLGQPLSAAPMVRSALALFSLLNEHKEIREITNLINSPFFCAHPEASAACAKLDLQLRATQKTHLSLSELVEIAYGNKQEAASGSPAAQNCCGPDSSRPGSPTITSSETDPYKAAADPANAKDGKSDDNPKDNSNSDDYRYYNYFRNNLKTVYEHAQKEQLAQDPTKTFAEWSKFFLNVLYEMHWPVKLEHLRLKAELLRDRHTDTQKEESAEEIQLDNQIDECCKLKNRFINLIVSLRDLDIIIKNPVDYDRALSTLEKLAETVIYQQPAAYKSPIHVSGILEAAGLRYDHAIVINYTDQVWPSLSSPLPYLPIKFQEALNMPGTGDDDIKTAQWINERLASLAPTGTISFANSTVEHGNARELHISHLVNGLNCSFVSSESTKNVESGKDKTNNEDTAASGQPWYWQNISECFEKDKNTPADAETTEDGTLKHNKYLEDYPNSKPPFPNPDNIKGGSTLLQNQLDCPFKALVQARWVEKEMEDSLDSPDARSKGKLVHKAMEKLWEKWNHRYANFLNRLNTGEYKQDIALTVEEILREQQDKRPDFGSTFYALEGKRLQNLLEDWFAQIETKKHEGIDDFEISCEVPDSLVLGRPDDGNASEVKPLTLALYLDRLDTIKDNSTGKVKYWLSDYKTSNNYTLSQWYNKEKAKENAREDDPKAYIEKVQLPMYALCIAGDKEKGESALYAMGYNRVIAGRYTKDDKTEYNHNCIAIKRVYNDIIEYKQYYEPPKKPDGRNKDYAALNGKQFSDLISTWKKALETLAAEFLNSHHPIDPRDPQKSCKYCSYRLICRHRV